MTADVYKWAPGGFFPLLTADGRTDDGTTYKPSMTVTLIKVD